MKIHSLKNTCLLLAIASLVVISISDKAEHNRLDPPLYYLEEIIVSSDNSVGFYLDDTSVTEEYMSLSEVMPKMAKDGMFSRYKKQVMRKVQFEVNEADFARMEELKKRFTPSTRRELYGVSLQVLEGIIQLYDKGGKVFYSATGNREDAVELEILA